MACGRGGYQRRRFLIALLSAVLLPTLTKSDNGRMTSDLPTDPPLHSDPAILTLRPQEVTLEKGQSKTFNLSISGYDGCLNVSLELSGGDIGVVPDSVVVCGSGAVVLNTTRQGYATLSVIIDQDDEEGVDARQAFSVISVMKDQAITTTADVLGWAYTIAWDVSFLPQIFHNWRRKSVVGLSFDFQTFNFLGFFCYFLYNMGMLWIPAIQDEYYERHPTSILHVRLNDVIFPLYALLCTGIQIAQCFFYKKDPGQRVSIPCMVISSLLVLSAIIGLILVPTVDSLLWIDLLYWLSYIKLIISAIKYSPQLYINYKSRSTKGWSIYQVMLDFTGGSLSLVQMFLLAANYDDWLSILTDPAKLGLGVLSIVFNILFFIQHYCLYGGAEEVEKEMDAEKEEGGEKKEGGEMEKGGEKKEGADNEGFESELTTHI